MLKTYKLVYPVLLAGLFLSTTLLGAGKIKPPVDTKKLESTFKNGKCGLCHSWAAYELGKPQKKTEDPLADDQFATSGPPDLSKLSPELLKEVSKSKTFLEEFLTRKAKLRGKQHAIMFKGTDQDLKFLTKTLLEQKEK